MEITAYQVHNVLRTHKHLIKKIPNPIGQESQRSEQAEKGLVSGYDKVSLSDGARERLKEDDPGVQEETP